ncbi:hypothetical protein DEO72_LG11g2033 [Vigna unguiculata]|uniref:Uncharacterized protein n=1 Tax=Vigna unguiculata TaxID=3917 RepID=A0A4D6NRX7_VIGUN|nr:hypothetical protein DEO72_LG11g2033 [Vigna unguiculata]
MKVPPGGTSVYTQNSGFRHELPGGETELSGDARCALGDRPSMRDHCTTWCLAAKGVPPAMMLYLDREMLCHERVRVSCSRLRDDACGEVRDWWITCIGLRAGSSPFLFVFGDDYVIRYTGADDDTVDAEDAQVMK